MPISFPSNPSSGDTYDFGGIHYIYNGDGWVNKSIYGISAGSNISFANYNGTGPLVISASSTGGGITSAVTSINGLSGEVGISAGQDMSISIVGNTLAFSSPTVYGISANIYASSLATGLLHGGIVSINAGNTAQFDITSGRGQIHASGSTYTADPQPIFNYVTWPSQTGVTVTNLATSDTTWLYIDSSGNLQQRTEYYTDDQLVNTIIIGQLVHPSRTYINLARTNPNVAYATDKQYEQFIRSFGPIKVSGHSISPNGANLKLNRSSGKAFSLGRNWINNTDDPSVVSDPAQTDCTFFRYYRGATAGTFITVPNQTEIDPTSYDDGSGTLATVPGGKYTIQRLFYYPNTPTLLGVYYGRAEYTSIATAAANIDLENFSEIENTRTNAIFAGYLIVKSGATDLTNTADALIIQAGSFRSTSSGGGSVSLTLDDLTDVIIASPIDYQVLTYVDGVTGWENKSVSELPLVYSFNGLSGAVQGVSAAVAGTGISVSGATGSVTITNTGVLSFNGNTGAIQGVSSVNGATGAITNVAKTNVNNLFSASQNISAPGGYIVVENSSNLNYAQLDPTQVIFYDDFLGGEVFLQPTFPVGGAITVTLPGFDTTIAGLAGTQTFTGNKTFSTLASFSGGLSASIGVTFANNISVNTAKLGKTGSNLIFGDSSSGNSISTGINNTIIGEGSGGSLTSGNQNACVGYQTLNSLTTGDSNTAVGFWALRNGTTGSNNTAIGTRALRSNTTGSDNIGIGIYALELNETGSANIAIGGFALSEGATSAANNIAIGYAALLKNTTGTQNIAIGRDAVRTNTTASNNVGIGYRSLYSATSGGANTGVGTNTGYRLTTGTNNTAIGYQALFGSASVTSQANTAVGYNSMVSNTSGSYNSGIGLGSLYSLTSGQQNTAVGTESLYAITNTSNNTAVGQLALRYATQGSNNTAIGILAGAYKTETNTNLTAIGSNNVYIGSEARASGDSINDEIVIGSKALGLGANTAVIGATAQVSATIYGTLNLPGGLSASSGVTFAGTVSSDTGYRISSSAINTQTGTTYSLLSTDNGEILTFNNASAVTVTIPTGLPIGFNCTAIQLGAGQVGFTAAAGVTLNSYGGLLKLAGQHGAATIISYTTNVYNIAGTLST